MTKTPHLLPKLNVISDYRTSPMFSDKERAALDYATELTELRRVTPETFEALSPPLFRARNLRDRVDHRQREPLQHQQPRAGHRLGRALRDQPQSPVRQLASAIAGGIPCEHARMRGQQAGAWQP